MKDFSLTPEAKFLQHDPRPTFVLTKGSQRFDILFCNDAGKPLQDSLEASESFAQWAIGRIEGQHDCAGYNWIGFNASADGRDLWIISGNRVDVALERRKVTKIENHEDEDENATNLEALRMSLGKFVTPELDAHLKVIGRTDWSKAGLGIWPPELIETLRMMLILTESAAVILGEATMLMYNMTYASRIGIRHPEIMGKPVLKAWPNQEIQNASGEAFESLAQHGYHIFPDPILFSTNTSAYPDENWAAYTVLTLSETLKSALILSADVTSAIIETRRRSSLAQVRRIGADCQTVSGLYEGLLSVCISNPHDLPFMLLYSCQGGSAIETLRLEARAPASPDLAISAISETLGQAMASSSSLFLSAEAGSLPIELQDLACVYGFGDQARDAVAFCLRSGPLPQDVYGFVILGLNPRRSLDESHKAFVDSIVDEISRYAAASVRRAKIAKSSEYERARHRNFNSLVEMTDCGLFEYSNDGKLINTNKAFHRQSGHPVDLEETVEYSWVDLIYPEDLDVTMKAWKQLLHDGKAITFDFRWKWTHTDLTEDEKEAGGRWITASCLSVIGDDGEPQSIVGFTIDITAQKRATKELTKALEKARAAEEQRVAASKSSAQQKEQLENFDILFSMSECALFEYSIDGRLTKANEAFFNLSGFDRDLSKQDAFTFQNLVCPDDLDHIWSIWGKIAESGVGDSFEFRWKWTKPKEELTEDERELKGRWVVASALPVLDQDGKTISITGFQVDCTAQKLANLNLLRRNEVLASIAREQEKSSNFVKLIEMTESGVFEYDASGKLVFANAAFHRLSNFPVNSEEQDAFTFKNLVHEDDVDMIMAGWSALADDLKPQTFDFRYKFAPDRILTEEEKELGGQWVIASCLPVLDEQGRCKAIVGFTFDTMATKRATLNLEKRNAALELAREAGERFGLFAENAPVGIYVFNAEKNLQYHNPAFDLIAGLPEGADYDVPVYIHEDDLPIIDASFETVLTERKPVEVTVRMNKQWKAPDGSNQDTWISASSYPVFAKSGEVTSIQGVMSDISSLKFAEHVQKVRVEEALEAKRVIEETEARFKTFAESASAGIYIFNDSRQLAYANKEFLAIFGVPAEDTNPLDFDYTQWVLPEDIPSVDENFRLLLVEHQPVKHEFRLKRHWLTPRGEEVPMWVSASSSPNFDSKTGKIQTCQGIMVDISSLKWAESIKRKEVEEAVEAKRQQERFIDMTSHELRNPLSAVVQSADVVLESLNQCTTHAKNMLGCTPSQAQKHFARLKSEIESGLDAIATIESCSVHQKRIIDDILTLSKLDAKLLTIAPILVRYVDSISQCTKMFHSAAQAQEIELVLDTHESLQRLNVDWVQIDASRVNQVIINLLTNAIKFTQTEKIRRITVKCGASRLPPDMIDGVIFTQENEEEPLSKSADGSGVYLWCAVTDTGSGLSRSQQDMLFNRFSQAFAPKTYSRYGGSGLGLFISRSLSELQGGQIGVYSAGQGKGSTFSFFVKARTATPPKAIEAELDNLTLAEAEEQNKLVISVLVVEDNIVNSKVLCKQLKKQGFEVHVAYHGGEALEFLKTSRHWNGGNADGPGVSIILMDAEMPVMDGLTCTRNIRRLENEGQITSHLPIIAVSANARQEQMAEMRASGMDDGISKPFRIPDLLPKIQRLVRRASLS